MSRQLTLQPRDNHPPRWALALLALGLMAAAALAFAWLDARDTGDEVAGNPARFSRPEQAPAPPREAPAVAHQPKPARPRVARQEPVTELRSLLEVSSVEALIGRQVVLDDVPVQDVVGDFTFWVGEGATARVSVVLRGELTQRQPETQVQVRQGQRVRIFGILRRMRDAESLAAADEWLSPRELEALRQEPFFISATRVVPLGPPP